ncbi:DNA phosphorothioation-dependent restriction protein DptG [Phytophthora nicotianae P1569]|uniref:DNA phosphorothioation-dependent restriction protein DptG n=1 Tax=Phytophthora nicotianae P1569 TaxID=1317065 RepID=V9FJ48_PHYNI|nr:DNA phosphorothioation-dependent restriction protein DptG [Phytophthora nicotianae P1569]
MKAEPNEKGVRAFSLFPVSTTYTASHTKINGATLAGFYLRIKKREKKFCWQIPGVEVSTESFQQNRWVVMRNAFAISRIETRSPLCPLPNPEFASLPVEEKYKHASHLFANQVTMDGYGASLLLFGPRQRKMTRRGRKRGLLSTPSSPLGTCRTPSLDWIQGCKPFVRPSQKIYALIGKDTVDNEDADPGVAPQRQCDRDVVRISTREYRHLDGFNKFRKWNECLKKRDGEYQRVIADMSSFKTASLKKYLECLDYFWHHANFLLEFCAEHSFLKWKFFIKRMAPVAVDAIAKRIVPEVSTKTCVAYGDWSKRNGIRSHVYSPVKGLKQALQKRAMVVSMDRTSKLCSQCHQMLSSVQYLVATKLMKRKKRKGTVLIRNRPEVQFEKKKCYGVLRCDHEGCGACYWDRDVNAAINMLELLKSEILGLGRMVPFNRK